MNTIVTPGRLVTEPPAIGKSGPWFTVETGRQFPLGATVDAAGINFALFSPHATAVDLLLFAAHDDPAPFATVRLVPEEHKTFHFWHVYLRGAPDRLHYAYRVHGVPEPSRGCYFDPDKALIDPYSRADSKTLWNRTAACRPGDNVASAMRSIAVDHRDYDWEGDRPLGRAMHETIVYELHVGGFTRGAGSGVAHPGTFSAVIEKIPYLKDLGVTAVELLPVFGFDDQEARQVDGRRLTNYWGYSTISYFAPHPGYCVKPELGDHVTEFRDMVKALHRAGIEVILDVVFNHTDEGNHLGPVYSFKGYANEAYYFLSPGDRRYYVDYSGCGNTFNANHPIGEKFVLDCLRYWVREMHVDGFRFDEASVLSRGEDGAPLEHPPVLWQVELDETLAGSKVIAEAWDAAGLYQVGHFPGARWAEWNGRYRDDVRRFVRGDGGLAGAVAGRITGSADLYASSGRLPINSLNFVTCHDGFTLNDLVSYDQKHNEANGEGNRDGVDDNMSWNCGAEGPAGPGIEALRDRQVKNFAAILLLSQGVPMMLMGDEVRRSQRGNNNGYCQDNEIGWFDWQAATAAGAVSRFWQRMIAFRKQHPAIHHCRYLRGTEGPANPRGLLDITWHGTQIGAPDWSEGSRVIAYTLAGTQTAPDVHVMINMYWETLAFEIPAIPGMAWRRAVDTALASPADIAEPGAEPVHAAPVYHVEGRSIAVLINRPA